MEVGDVGVGNAHGLFDTVSEAAETAAQDQGHFRTRGADSRLEVAHDILDLFDY